MHVYYCIYRYYVKLLSRYKHWTFKVRTIMPWVKINLKKLLATTIVSQQVRSLDLKRLRSKTKMAFSLQCLNLGTSDPRLSDDL